MEMIIKPSKTIRNNYNEISTLCKETRQPVCLTKNGEGDLVVLDIDTFYTMQSALELRDELDRVQEMRKLGVKDIPAAQVIENMRAAIREASHV